MEAAEIEVEIVVGEKPELREKVKQDMSQGEYEWAVKEEEEEEVDMGEGDEGSVKALGSKTDQRTLKK